MSLTVKRILIVRLTAIGDCVHSLPILNALRAKFPSAFIAWAVEGVSEKLLAGHAALDQVIRLPRRFYKAPSSYWGITRQLRAFNFDVTIDPQGLTKSAAVARVTGAPCRIGFDLPDGKEMSRFLNNTLVTPTTVHVVDRCLELLRPLGIDKPEVAFALPHDARSTALMHDFLARHSLTKPFAVLNPGAGWPSKLWPPQRFAEVARYLGKVHDLRSVIVWAGPAEQAWAHEIEAAADGHGLLAPPTSLPEFTALARSARLVVSSDSGPLHIAAAVGTPCIGLFGPKPATRNGAYGAMHVNIQKITPSGKIRNADNLAMLAIDVADVNAACDHILVAKVDTNLRRSA